MENERLLFTGWFGRTIGILMILIFFSSCATTMTVNAIDPNGRPIDQATVLVNSENIGKTPSASTRVSNAVWEDTVITVIAEGYSTRTTQAVKEVKIGTLIAGLFLIWIPLLWVYGPKAQQNVVLMQEQ